VSCELNIDSGFKIKYRQDWEMIVPVADMETLQSHNACFYPGMHYDSHVRQNMHNHVSDQ